MLKYLMNHIQKLNNNEFITKEWEEFLKWEWGWSI